MSFHILNSKNEIVFTFDDKEIKFLDEVLEADVSSGIAVPLYLQEMFGKQWIDYPPKNPALFAEAYKHIIFENELINHGYIIKETATHGSALKV